MANWKKYGAALALMLIAPQQVSAQDKQTADSVLAHHLASMSASQQQTGMKSRSAAGAVEFHIIADMQTELKGKAWLFAEGRKLRIAFPFGHPDYPGEHAVFDGEKATIQSMLGGQRSSLGQFLTMFDTVLREGLLGGTLSTNWSLLDLQGHQARLTYDGLKKVDGVSAHILTYQPKKPIGTMKIQLAFARDTFRHIRTTYRVRLATPLMASLPGFVAGLRTIPASQETQITVEEIFDGFEVQDGMTLPTLWTLRISQSMVGTAMGATITTSNQPVPTGTDPGRPLVLEWRTKFEKLAHNEHIPAEVFVLQP